MVGTGDLTNQLYSVLSDISHPIEGTFYLFLLAIIFRWRWPGMWNSFLKKISAPASKSINSENKTKFSSNGVSRESVESQTQDNSYPIED